MNLSLVVIGHLSNPFDLNGAFSVHFSADDFTPSGSIGRASSRGFNLSVGAGSARPDAVHFLVVRLSDGLRIEGYAGCPPGQRNYVGHTAQFTVPDSDETFGSFSTFLHWDGTNGILLAHWTAPRQLRNAKSSDVANAGPSARGSTSYPVRTGS